MKHSESCKFIAITLAAVVTLIISYCMNYETVHTIHHCTGEDCPICHQLHIADGIVKQLQKAVIPAAAILFILFIMHIIISSYAAGTLPRSLVSDKVRLDN